MRCTAGACSSRGWWRTSCRRWGRIWPPRACSPPCTAATGAPSSPACQGGFENFPVVFPILGLEPETMNLPFGERRHLLCKVHLIVWPTHIAHREGKQACTCMKDFMSPNPYCTPRRQAKSHHCRVMAIAHCDVCFRCFLSVSRDRCPVTNTAYGWSRHDWGPGRFITAFAYALPFDHLLRVWDVFLLEGMKVRCRCCRHV